MSEALFHSVGDPVTLASVCSLPAVMLDRDWSDSEFQPGVKLRFAASPRTLAVAGHFTVTPSYDQSLLSGEFHEGLWEMDVFELFLGDESGSYVEINLAPGGAWWGAAFSAYRTLRGECRAGIETEAVSHGDRWDALISVSLGELPISRPVAFNVCAIVGASPRKFLSLGRNANPGAKPDFHLNQNWLPLRRE